MVDIQGMFNQVYVSDDDCDVFCFLWWKDDDLMKILLMYWMMIYFFGGVWLFSCVNFVLKKCV